MSTTAGISQTGSTTSSISISYGASTTTPPISSWSVSGPAGVIASGGGTSSVSGSATVSGLSAGTSYSFSITATSASATDTRYYSFSTSSPPPPPPPVWTDNTLGAFQVGAAYSDGVAATNGPAYSVLSGSLPGGISLNTSTGAVTGTPTTAGAFSFTLRASNGGGAIDQAFSGSVAAAPTYPPAWSDNTLAQFIVGQSYSDTVTATNMSYSGAYSVSSGALPAGISLNTSTGAVTGTPTSPAAYSFALTATNTYGTISQSFSGSVGGGLAVYDGTSWYRGPVKVYNGTTWDLAVVKTYNGSTWVVTK